MPYTTHSPHLPSSSFDHRPSESVQLFAQQNGPRLVESLEPLVTVIATVVTARIHAAQRFMATARASASAYDLRDLAVNMPLPRLSSADTCFMASVFTAACDTIPTLFDGPRVNVEEFLGGLMERSQLVCEGGVSNAALLLMLVYMDKLYAKCPALMLSEGNAGRIMAAAYTVAAKVVEDVPYGATAMARLLGVDREDLLQLESGFMILLGYELHVSAEAFAEAEVSFMAEALETADAGNVLRSLHVGGISGLEQALGAAGNWVTADHATVPTPLEEYHGRCGVSEFLSYTGDKKFWRAFSEAQCRWVAEAEMRRRIIALACAQYRTDFRHIALALEEEEGEWCAMALCKREGVNRYLRLRAIMQRKDLTVTELAAMRKRPVAFMSAPGERELEAGADFVLALGDHGRAVVGEQWRTALVIPDPLEEAGEDAGLELAPLPPPVWHIRRMGAHRDSDSARGWEDMAGDMEGDMGEGRRGNHGGLCTPVGSPGGLVLVDPPIFHDPELLERIRSAPPCQEIPRPEPRQPPGFSEDRSSHGLHPSPQHRHPPGFPSRPPSPCREGPQFVPHGQAPTEHYGPPGFPARPARATNSRPHEVPSRTGCRGSPPTAKSYPPPTPEQGGRRGRKRRRDGRDVRDLGAGSRIPLGRD